MILNRAKKDLVRVDVKTKKRLKEIKFTLEPIEQTTIPLGEIIARMSKGEDMLRRLKKGSEERKQNSK